MKLLLFSVPRALRLLLLPALAALTLALLAPAPAPAAGSAKEQIKQNREKRNQIFEQIRQLESKKDAMLKQVGTIDENIAAKQSDIRKVKKELKAAEEMEKQLSTEVAQLSDDLTDYRNALAGRMRAIYMQGDMTYLDLLFQSSDFGDLIDRLFFIQTIGKRDETLISGTQDSQAALIEQQRLLADKREEIEKINAQLQQDLSEMQIQRSNRWTIVESIRNSIALQERVARDLEEDNKRIAAALRRAQSGGGGGYQGKWSGSFKKPCPGSIVSGFGYRNHPIFGKRKMHTGVDIAAPEGTTIIAAGDGKVIDAGRMGGYGLAVVIDHGNGRATLYGHCSEINCKVGDVVAAGEKIAEVGSTGYSTGPHCHFEVRIKGTPVDPLQSL
ncbi:peptidoglycan DD-metalloendopeptidase family protein [bacterium]|nr:peptidoglycan DD-metalloendopeptidase family protein [bacterium]